MYGPHNRIFLLSIGHTLVKGVYSPLIIPIGKIRDIVWQQWGVALFIMYLLVEIHFLFYKKREDPAYGKRKK